MSLSEYVSKSLTNLEQEYQAERSLKAYRIDNLKVLKVDTALFARTSILFVHSKSSPQSSPDQLQLPQRTSAEMLGLALTMISPMY